MLIIDDIILPKNYYNASYLMLLKCYRHYDLAVFVTT